MADQTSNTYTITNLAATASKIKAMGGPAINLSQPAGTAKADGIVIGWLITGNVVKITIVQKPWLISYGTIWDHINSVLA